MNEMQLEGLVRDHVAAQRARVQVPADYASRVLRSLDAPAVPSRRVGFGRDLLAAVAVFAVGALMAGGLVWLRVHSNERIGTPRVRVEQHGLVPPAGCPGWSSSPSGGGFAPASDKMTSQSAGWANGALRTADGGAHWQRVAPDTMLADAPNGTDPRAYPPSYADYFLDSNHGWLAYSSPSATACFDHVTVYTTVDGGHIWQRSHPVDAPVQEDSTLQLQVSFIDARHGWLLVLGGGRLAPDWFVFTTTNGGLDWRPLSQIPVMSSFCSLVFISETVGFLGGCPNAGGPAPELAVTRDGGKTWELVTLPAPIGTQFTVASPVFFGQNRGIVRVTAMTFQGNTETSSDYLAVTDDGGKTWRALPQLSIRGFAQAFAFVDINHFFALVNDTNGSSWAAYGSADGGRTWSLVGRVPPVDQNYAALIFLDSQHGFIDEPSQKIGDGPIAFFATSDGGRTWRNLHPQVQ